MNLNVFLAGMIFGAGSSLSVLMLHAKFPWWTFVCLFNAIAVAVLWNISIKGIDIPVFENINSLRPLPGIASKPNSRQKTGKLNLSERKN